MFYVAIKCHVTGLHNEELHILYSSPNIIEVVKSRRMRWAGFVALLGEMKNKHTILGKKYREETTWKI
jgi:hypothetical protein